MHMVRSRSLWRVVVVHFTVMMGPMHTVGRGRHVMRPLVEHRRVRPVLVGEVHTVMGHMRTMVGAAGPVRLAQRFDPEIATHRAAAFAHTMALADRAAFTGDFVTWSVAG